MNERQIFEASNQRLRERLAKAPPTERIRLRRELARRQVCYSGQPLVIQVTVEGGIVQNVASLGGFPVRVEVKDYDLDGTETKDSLRDDAGDPYELGVYNFDASGEEASA